ncbi:hypothetical protein CAEBREN_25325 [Caenorhabditis brenneri]|uniref:Maelstrom domain-containing protein n=1 Tax=Caenorhabditis brenneri TaxID=135651 RepID=G0MET8_CAEBE|nr:hypothetical protein CAEBREN_25325 [Caenorhabditis brenneri]
MRKQNRPNQASRKQMQNLTVELFARDKNARRQLLDEALAVSPTTTSEPAPPSTSSEQPAAISPTSEPIQELVQVLLAPEPKSASSVVDSTPVPTVPVENPVPYVTPPPLQRVPYDAPPCRLANIRAVTESMNIAAIPSQPHHSHPSEPMSFAACVRKQPSIESMSISPSPYAKPSGFSANVWKNDGECMMAEIALNEFSLFSGIIEKFHAIVGPWQTDNESQRRRAKNFQLVEEILGRVEPSIACHQGVKVGLYSDSCNEKTRIELNIKNNFKDPGMICDKNDRRFVLVLQSELDLMVESMKHLAKTVGFHYDGFPVHHNNFVIVEAFVEAISDIMNEKVDMETMRWFSLLGQKIDAEDSVSPWETGTDFHCSRHSEPKSNFCAAVTVGRTCCIIYHVLGGFFRRYHLKKIPTAHHIPSTSTSIQ